METALDNKYITAAYELFVMTDGEKEMKEKATAEHPFQFITGLGGTLDIFEKKLKGLNKGDKFEFTIPANDAYGDFEEENVRRVPKNMFEIEGKFDEERIFEGNVIPLMDSEGHHFYGTVTEVAADTIVIDLNHPLAGKDLTFIGEIIDSRPATNEEIQEEIKMMSGGGGCSCCEGGCDDDACGCDDEACGEGKEGCCGGGHCH